MYCIFLFVCNILNKLDKNIPKLNQTICVLGDHWVKIKGNKKRDKYLDLAWEVKKLWNMKMTVILIVIGALGTIPKGLVRGLEGLEIGGRTETIQDNSIVKIGQNTEKSPRDLIRLAVTQTKVKYPQLTLVWKTRKE